jgi:hypothetical protein
MEKGFFIFTHFLALFGLFDSFVIKFTFMANTIKKSKAKEPLHAQRMEILEVVENEIHTAKMLSELHIENEMTKFADGIIHQPIETFLKMSNSYELVANTILENEIIELILKNKKYLHSAYKTFQEPILHFCLILKKENFNHRVPFLKMISTHILKGYQDKLPLVFQFVPENMEKELKAYKKLIPNE